MQFFKKFVAVLLTCGSFLFAQPSLAVTYVCVDSTLGTFCMEMLEADAPLTVANFLNYVRDGDFNNTFIHRTVPNFVVQGGGYKLDPLAEPVPEDAQVPNEFKVPNTRGTVAMAKLGDQPDSATSQWFVNLTDNTDLNTTNGGFTVFAKIVYGMSVVDTIGNSQRVDLTASLGEVFNEVPVTDLDADGVGIEDLMWVKRVYITDVVPVDPVDTSYACTAEWVQTIAPTQACMDTTLGSFCIDLTPDAAPQTVANFLHYVADGDYNNSFFHRNVKDFVVQGGGYKLQPLFSLVPSDPVVPNEFNVSNTRGTVAMARSSAVDSATNQWFVNVKDNTHLDTENGGFTVFGRINEEGMAVIDQINALPTWNFDTGNFPDRSEIPLLRDTLAGDLNLGDFVKIANAYIPNVGPNPCFPVKPAALTELADGKFEVPVRFGSTMYQMIFIRELNSPGEEIAFRVDVNKIRTVIDQGQEAATYTPDDRLMVIPSVLINGNDVVTNVMLRLTNPTTLTFTVESYIP
jgi:cyclophilin family peptidyl-prolyl cis-trans isomerase